MARSPADKRVGAVESSPSGHIVPSGVSSFKKVLENNASGFADWRRHPITRKVCGALQDMVMHNPPECASDDLLVQYGVTQGLTIALQMIADPSVIWPGVFGKDTNEAGGSYDLPLMDFDTSIDDVIGNA